LTSIKWIITLKVSRPTGQEPRHFQLFPLEVDPDEYVLDAVERVWAFHDRSLCFRHACHHSTCGACGMLINGVEKLTCITQVREVTQNGGRIKVEPLRNFPVISDLAVDMGSLYSRMEMVGAQSVLPVTMAEIEKPVRDWPKEDSQYIRLSDCIECGLCISACPISNTSSTYLGPAVLAGAHQKGVLSDPGLLPLVDCEDGAWRCHSAFECTAVCPSYVDPARRIMELRRQIVFEKLNSLFRPNPKKLVVKEANR